MANTISPLISRTTLQASGTLSGNGSAAAIAGAKAALISITKSTGTAGIYAFEKSTDEGQNWSALTVTRVSDGSAISSTAAAESGETYLVPLIDGDTQIRARISTNWVTSAPAAIAAILN